MNDSEFINQIREQFFLSNNEILPLISDVRIHVDNQFAYLVPISAFCIVFQPCKIAKNTKKIRKVINKHHWTYTLTKEKETWLKETLQEKILKLKENLKGIKTGQLNCVCDKKTMEYLNVVRMNAPIRILGYIGKPDEIKANTNYGDILYCISKNQLIFPSYFDGEYIEMYQLIKPIRDDFLSRLANVGTLDTLQFRKIKDKVKMSFRVRYNKEKSFQKTITIDPNSPYKRNNQALVSEIKKYFEEAKKTEAQIKKEKINELKKNQLYGNILAIAILKLCEANEDYIIEGSIVSALRGTQIKSSVDVKTTNDCGKFSFCNKEEIQEMMKLLIKDNLLKPVKRNGQYKKFYIYRPVKQDIYENFINPEPDLSRKIEDYRDIEWIQILDNENPKYLSLKIWQTRVDMIYSRLFSYKEKEMANYFLQAPDVVQKYINVMSRKSVTHKKLLTKMNSLKKGIVI